MEATLYSKSYYDARNNFEADIAAIKRQFGISYYIIYGQFTDSVDLDITNDLPEQVKSKIMESFRRHFRSFLAP